MMFTLVGVFLAGLVVGSFLNVCIYRLPRGLSLIRPGSACPACREPIAAFDNIPVLSYLLLRGRCRRCGVPIPWRYPLVEILTGGGFALFAWRMGMTWEILPALLLFSALMVVTLIDLEHQLIPDKITLPGVLVGLLANLAVSPAGWWSSLIGTVVGGGIFFLIVVISGGGMGGGDLKLAAMLGAFLGWQRLLVAIFLAVVGGGAVGGTLLLLKIRGRKDPIPFGPFLAAGGVASLLAGNQILAWYWG